MRQFIRVYRWAMEMKFHMAIYTVMLIFFRAAWSGLHGVWQVETLTLLELWGAALLFALIESALFPQGLDPRRLGGRTWAWALAGNVIFVGGALLFQWFPGVTAAGAAVMLVLLEGGLWCMWFGLHVATRMDSEQLNRRLRQIQRETEQ